MISQDSHSGLPNERAALLAEAMQKGLDARRFVRPDTSTALAETPYVEEEPQVEPPVEVEPPPSEPPKRSVAQKILRELQRPLRQLLKRLPLGSSLKADPVHAVDAENLPDPMAEFREMISSCEQKIHDLEAYYSSMLASERLACFDSTVARNPSLAERDLTDHAMECLFVHTRLPAPPARVLVLGCSQSKIALEMASLGFEVVGVDRQQVSLQHPNLTTIQANGANLPVAAESFDVVVSISAIAKSQSGESLKYAEASQMTTEALRVLRRGGQFLVTAPYTTADEPAGPAVDPVLLESITRPFHVRETSFALLDGECWNVTSDEATARIDASSERTNTMVLVAMQKG